MTHGITLRSTDAGTALDFAEGFNVAGPFIDRHVEEGRGPKIAIWTATEAVTYRQLAERVNRASNALLGLGATPGDRVLMIVKDCPAFYYAFWGAIKAGIVPVPVNTLLRASDYAYMIDDSGCRVALYSPEYAAEVEPALLAATNKPLALRADGAFADELAAASDQLAIHPASATADCFWLYSSGSTGRPKGAVHGHRDMVVTSQFYGVETLGVRKSDVCFSSAKLFFAYGLGNGMTFPLWTGGTALLDDRRPTPDGTFELVERFRPTLYFGVPTLYAALLAALETRPADWSSVRAGISAGEALPGDIFRRFHERTGVSVLDGIGSTEALHIFLSNRLGDIRLGASGKPVHGYGAEIRDEHGKPVPPGESGRLWIKGDSTARLYWNKPEKTAETMVGGWLDTGDTYRQDAEGYFFYDGRSDDMLKVGGIWCSPIEIESCLIGHDAVLESAVVGHADKDGLVKPRAFVVVKPGRTGDDALTTELMTRCKATLAPYKFPRSIDYVAELPKTATGKIQRFKLRD